MGKGHVARSHQMIHIAALEVHLHLITAYIYNQSSTHQKCMSAIQPGFEIKSHPHLITPPFTWLPPLLLVWWNEKGLWTLQIWTPPSFSLQKMVEIIAVCDISEPMKMRYCPWVVFFFETCTSWFRCTVYPEWIVISK